MPEKEKEIFGENNMYIFNSIFDMLKIKVMKIVFNFKNFNNIVSK